MIAPKGSKAVYVPTNPISGHISLTVCMNAEGKSVTPTIIFQGKRLMEGYVQGWKEANYVMTDCGYQTADSFRAWAQVFIKETRRADGGPVLLYLDQHYSHLDPLTLLELREAGVRVVALHPHTTHVLCALDVAYFAAFKKAFTIACDDFRVGRQVITKYDITGIIRTAYAKSSVVTHDAVNNTYASAIISGFEKTGLYPFNRDRIGKDVFAAANAILAHRDIKKGAVATAASQAAAPAYALTTAEAAALAADVFEPLTPIDPTVADTIRRTSRTKMAELLTGTTYLERVAADFKAKEDDTVAKEVKKVEKAAKKVEKLAAAAAQAQEKAKLKADRGTAKAAAATPLPITPGPEAAAGPTKEDKKRATPEHEGVEGKRVKVNKQERAAPEWDARPFKPRDRTPKNSPKKGGR